MNDESGKLNKAAIKVRTRTRAIKMHHVRNTDELRNWKDERRFER